MVDKGDEVHAFVRAESNLWRLKDIEEKIILHRVDVTSFSETERVVTKVTPDRVYHLVHYGGNRGRGRGRSSSNYY